MLKDVEKLLNEGMTPEEIYQESLRIVEAKRTAEAKMTVKMGDARAALIDAITNYAELLLGEQIPENMREQIDKELESYEQLVSILREGKDKCGKQDQSDNDRLYDFLKSIGAM